MDTEKDNNGLANILITRWPQILAAIALLVLAIKGISVSSG